MGFNLGHVTSNSNFKAFYILFTLFKEAQKWNVPGSVAGDDRGMREGVCVYVCVVLGQAPGLVSVM